MSISNNRKIRKGFFALGSSVASASIIIITLTLLAGGFVLLSPTPMTTTALAQEEENNTTTETTTTTTSDTATIMSNLNFSEFPELNNSTQSEEFASLFSSFMTDVNGTYTNPDIGFQIDL
ncbi:MAG TPA: hypothetical protein VHJ59_04050, partial [Nitrososphaera sp.]|nr:hypothetical protein [Nitrososphaera sp.]